MERNKALVILDRAHGSKKYIGLQKCSPVLSDGKSRFFEWEFSRDVIKGIAAKLKSLGVNVEFTVDPDDEREPGLSVRASRANTKIAEARKNGIQSTMFVSVHVNAAGNGQWMNARGWSVWTTKGQNNSDKFATCLWNAADKIVKPLGMTMRADRSDGDPDYESNFTVIYKTNTVAVLTENFFMDNKEDLKFLMSDEGKQATIDLHVEGILDWIDKL